MRLKLFTSAWLLVAAACLIGQTVAPDARSTTSPDVPILIAAGDLLDISIYDNQDLNQEVRVESGGMVTLNLIGSARLGGMTPRQASDWIAKQYTDRKYLVRPQISVLIKEYATEGVSVTGEVNHPGVYPVLATRTILDVISMAGGLTNLADTRVTIKHRSGGEDRVTVKLRTDEAAEELDENTVVYPGDLVVVPRAGVVYVLGDVGRPGGLAMQDNGRITLLQALAQSGGANYTAAMNGAYLLHKNDTGYSTTRIKVGDIMQGKGADLQLARNDILYIPSSKIKRFAAGTQSMVSQAAGAAIYKMP